MNSSRIAFLSVISNSFVVVLKIIVGIFTGSVAVLSEAIHSSLDLVASLIAFFSVRISNRPADKLHPYGHGKVENISGTIETLLIFVAGIWIIYECIHKLLKSCTNPTSFSRDTCHVDWGWDQLCSVKNRRENSRKNEISGYEI